MKHLTALLFTLAVACLPAIAFGQETTEPPFGDLLSSIVNAIGQKQWILLAGFAIMMLVSLADRFDVFEWIPGEAQKWAAMVIGVALAVAGGLIAGASWGNIITSGVLAGFAAIGSWETIAKRFRKDTSGLPVSVK